MTQKRGQQRKRQYMAEFQTMRPEEKAQQISLALLLLHRLIRRQQVTPPSKQKAAQAWTRRA